MKKLLSQEEAMVPDLFCNLKHAMLPLMDDSIYETMKDVLKSIEGRDTNKRKLSQSNDAELNQGTTSCEGGARQRKRMKKEAAAVSDNRKQSNGAERNESSATLAQSAVSDNEAGAYYEGNDDLGSTVQMSMKCTADFCVPCFELA